MHDPDQGFPIRNHGRKTALSVRTESNRKPSLVNRELDCQVPASVWSTWIPANGPRAIIRELTIGERAICENRANEFSRGLLPFTADEREGVDYALSTMIGGFQRHLEMGPIVDVLLDVLREFPAWAILDGCTKITSDQHGLNPPFNPNFGPTDNQVYQVIAGIVAPYRQKLTKIQNLLSAPVEQKPEDPPPSQTWEETKAELAARGMNFAGEKRHYETANTVMAKHGVSQEAWDALPNYDQKKHTSEGRNS
jgi:hypothetical protein